jgi:deoxyribose-phosphate aldolase
MTKDNSMTEYNLITKRRKIMTEQEILSHVDHTVLKATTTWEDIVKICEESIAYKTASICIPPCYIKRIADTYGDKVNICTVVGFPLGYAVTAAKVAEVEQALADGVSEVDMVINITDVKNGEFAKVEEEIATLKKVVGNKILKVIIETCYLNEEEKIAMCKAVTNAGADYIKTSTGFGTAGATLEDIKLFKKYIGPNVKIKAAGGIKTVADMENFLAEGCDRLGTSSAISILQGNKAGSY